MLEFRSVRTLDAAPRGTDAPWLAAADAGWLFERGTDARVPDAYVAAGAVYGEGWERGEAGTLAAQLEAAQTRARAAHPDAELMRVAFVAR